MDAPECQSRELSLSEIRTLSWKAERLLPESMEALVQARKPILFELACAPDSVLTKQMQQITNRPSSAQRFAYWNGYDIGTNTGVRAILVAIKKQRPEHVWISTECGPFSYVSRMQAPIRSTVYIAHSYSEQTYVTESISGGHSLSDGSFWDSDEAGVCGGRCCCRAQRQEGG